VIYNIKPTDTFNKNKNIIRVQTDSNLNDVSLLKISSKKELKVEIIETKPTRNLFYEQTIYSFKILK